jgi:hypothetical protein
VDSAAFWEQLDAACASLRVQRSDGVSGGDACGARVADALALSAAAQRLAWLAAVPPDERVRLFTAYPAAGLTRPRPATRPTDAAARGRCSCSRS